ncbi:SGNH/GDSL hydrolase family protein [Reichenbachiella versicolor]|uniref:SGNH/GDSL hydrolase family protein n=1 Tax=Reichenbachiella versicolor TaxID=1821036 RepID=UPI0013A55BAF|nr:SGNH/GDSL hydrolase family protein [Reichenbachiella versicolor]
MRGIKKIIPIVLVTICSSQVIAQLKPIFQDGQTVSFIGNSITQDGRYHMLIHAFHATRFPSQKVKFINAGVSGDVAGGMINRFEKDVLVYNPDYSLLMTGMNDMRGNLFKSGIEVSRTISAQREEALDIYKQQTEKLVDLILESGIKPILMTPSIYDQTAELKTPAAYGKNDALVKCAIHIRKLADKIQAPVVDLNSFMLVLNEKVQEQDPTQTIVSQDRVHPKHTGHFTMAYKILETLNAPKYVSKVVIDFKNKSVVEAQNCKVNLSSGERLLGFQLAANALPFPVTEEYQEGADLVPFQKQFNNEVLKVMGLKRGNYLLKIDEIPVDTLSSTELVNGINLANNTLTPQYIQAKQVFDLCLKYHQVMGKVRVIKLVEFSKLRDYKGADDLESKRAYLNKLVLEAEGKPWYPYLKKVTKQYFEYLPNEESYWKEIDHFRDKIFNTNKPKTRVYQLSKI